MDEVSEINGVLGATNDLFLAEPAFANQSALLPGPHKGSVVLEGAGSRDLDDNELGGVADDLPGGAVDIAGLGEVVDAHLGADACGGYLDRRHRPVIFEGK